MTMRNKMQEDFEKWWVDAQNGPHQFTDLDKLAAESAWQAALEHAGRGGAEYSQGVAGDGAAILKDGHAMTIEEILSELRHPPAPVVPEGVTKPNWKDHDGGAMPTELLNQPRVLVQFDNGALSFRARSADDWFDIVDCPTVARYTVIDTERNADECRRLAYKLGVPND